MNAYRIVLPLMMLALLLLPATARHRILSHNFKSLEVKINDDWQRMPVMKLGSNDRLRVDFDQLSHDYHRLILHIEPCNPDWTTCEGLFENDWLDGFNDRPIEDYQPSLNTTVLYTHYRFELPNDDMRLKQSGNYRLTVIDEDDDNSEVITVELRVAEDAARVTLGCTTNTDISLNTCHQQLSMAVDYGQLRVTNADQQIQTFVMQNGREDNMVANVPPTYRTAQGLRWEHCRQLIFDAGNEYRKFEVLDPSHPTMGLAHVAWDEEGRQFHAFPFYAEPRRSYVYDEDADGAFLLRNSDNTESEYTSDYVLVHYKATPVRHYDGADVIIDGRWVTEQDDMYVMEYDAEDNSYNATLLQKLGYYNYQLLLRDADGHTQPLPEEGSFYQTENRYTAFVYYRADGDRYWRLAAFWETRYS